MPIVPAGKRVLVTGANGYIAMWVVRSLLAQDYAVRGVVRTPEKGKHLERYFRRYGDKFETAVVEDITKEGAFNTVVKDIDAIEHTASPLTHPSEDPEAYIKPAVGGTVGILKSALHFGPSVQRVVLTSSTAAVVRSVSQLTTLNENDWNNTAVKEIEEKGAAAGAGTKYVSSKTLAERAAWDFYNQHKGDVNWDFVALTPCTVYGPTLQDVSKPEGLSTSLTWFYNAVVADSPKKEEALRDASSWVDVRDVADAHVLALQKEKAGGERIIVCGGSANWQEWIDVANSLKPAPPLSHPLPKGFPCLQKRQMIKYDTSKSTNILGLKYKTMEDTTRDTLFDFVSRGW